MKKMKFFLDFEKEEKWLNEMAKNGYEFIGKSFMYQFRLAEPKNANVKIDYRNFKTKEDFIDYVTLFEDCGWKHIAGSKNSGTHYFKRVNDSADEDIFSDPDSRAIRYKRLSEMYMTLAICYFPILMGLISQEQINVLAIFSPKDFYYTPGLWGKEGIDFWGSFLFETPFAVFRAIGVLFFPVVVILFLTFSIQANRHYKNTLS